MSRNEEPNIVWDIGTVSLTEFTDGILFAQVDVLGDGATAPPFEVQSPYGLFTRPRDPEVDNDGQPTKGCTALYGWEGSKGHVWIAGDPRATTKIPELAKGSTVLYSHRDDGNVTLAACKGDDGTFQVYVPFTTAVGDTPTKAHTIAVTPSPAGQESIGIVHGEGMALSLVGGGVNSAILKNKAGDAYIELNDNGANINANKTFFNAGQSVWYVPYPHIPPTPADKAHVLVMDPTADPPIVSLVHGEGMGLVMMGGGKNSALLKNKGGDAYIELNDDGFTVNGNKAFLNVGQTVVYCPNSLKTKAHTLIIDPSDTTNMVILAHGDGMALVMAPDGSTTLRGKQNVPGKGASIVITGDEKITMNGKVNLRGAVSLGDETAQPLALYAPLLAWGTAVQAACAAATPPITIPPFPALPLGATKMTFAS